MYDQNTFLHRADAAEYIGVSTRTIDRYIAKGKLSVTREHGNVLLLKEELDVIKENKNSSAAQVIGKQKSAKQTISQENTTDLSLNNQFAQEIHKYKVLYDDVKQELEKKDDLLRQMHYQLGVLETEGKSKIPMLDAQTERQELEKNISNLEVEKNLLLDDLKTARSGRSIFFIVSIVLLALLFIFFLIMGNLA
ncbi:TPA: hypothetical protein EYG96_02255 [Candidatus Gracilibacteria bacterium]|nr:hypothetical protein [Candidatus Peregrinibacteria bacterium]HIQ56844.1 hypothetical protein [Candidatus Gracilibacteria bacterium]HIQ57094.1 hypothetical protein [Candidatus Gracilibacteria bacterium]